MAYGLDNIKLWGLFAGHPVQQDIQGAARPCHQTGGRRDRGESPLPRNVPVEFFPFQLPPRRIARHSTRFWSPKRIILTRFLQFFFKKYHPSRRLFKVFGRVFL